MAGNKASEVAQVINDSKGGFYFDNQDKDLIINQIKDLIKNKEKAVETGKNARKYIVEHFSSDKILADFEKQIAQLIQSQ